MWLPFCSAIVVGNSVENNKREEKVFIGFTYPEFIRLHTTTTDNFRLLVTVLMGKRGGEGAFISFKYGSSDVIS